MISEFRTMQILKIPQDKNTISWGYIHMKASTRCLTRRWGRRIRTSTQSILDSRFYYVIPISTHYFNSLKPSGVGIFSTKSSEFCVHGACRYSTRFLQ